MKRPNFNPGPAELGLAGGGQGKGDCDRSPGWRKHYDEIEWPVIATGTEGGIVKIIDSTFRRCGSKLIKRYG